MNTVVLLLELAAVVLAFLAAINVSARRVNLLAAALFCFFLAVALPSLVLALR